MVGMVSSSYIPSVTAFTRVVFPAFCNPTIAISSSLLKSLLLIQSRTLFMKPNITNYKYKQPDHQPISSMIIIHNLHLRLFTIAITALEWMMMTFWRGLLSLLMTYNSFPYINMNPPNTSKNIIKAINRARMQRGLRVLWPDYQVYDLLEEGVPLGQLNAQTTARPTIVPLTHDIQNERELVDSAHFTHLAVVRKWVLSADLERQPQFWGIATRRGMAVDFIEIKHHHDQHIVWMEVFRLNTQVHLWGVHLSSAHSPPRLFGPSYIRRKQNIWYMEMTSPEPIRNIVFYSTNGQPIYNRVQPHGHKQLPRHATPHFAMRCRHYSSYVTSLHQQEDLLIQEPIRMPMQEGKYQMGGFMLQKGKNGEEQEEIRCIRPPVKRQARQMCIEQSIPTAAKKRELVVRNLTETSEITLFSFHRPLMIHLQEQLSATEKRVLEQLYSRATVQEGGLEQLEDVVRNFNEASRREKMEQLEKAKQMHLPLLQKYFFLKVAESFSVSAQLDQRRSVWLTLLKHASEIEDTEFSKLGRDLLETMFTLNHHLVRDADNYELEDISKLIPELKELLYKAMVANCGYPAATSDYLFTQMQLNHQPNIMYLYQQYPLLIGDMIVHESMVGWLEQHKIPINLNSDIVYLYSEQPKPIITLTCRSQNQATEHPERKIELALKSKISVLSQNSMFCSKAFQIMGNSFNIFLFRNRSQIKYFIEEQPQLNYSPPDPHFVHSYNIQITISIGEDYEHHNLFGFNFTNGARAVGQSFQCPAGDQTIQIRLGIQREVIHEAIINYLRMRVPQMARLPQNSAHNPERLRQPSQALSKKRSSFMLQRNQFQEAVQPMEEVCIFHESCGRCEWMKRGDSIYSVNLVDMLSLVLSGCFSAQIQALKLILKKLSLLGSEQNARFLFSSLRIGFLKVKQLLLLTKEAEEQGESVVNELMRTVIEERIRFEGGSALGCYFLGNTPRRPLERWLLFEQDYSTEYLSYRRRNQ